MAGFALFLRCGDQLVECSDDGAVLFQHLGQFSLEPVRHLQHVCHVRAELTPGKALEQAERRHGKFFFTDEMPMQDTRHGTRRFRCLST